MRLYGQQSGGSIGMSHGQMEPYSHDREYQARILPGVSRTFALTIPVLPKKLADVVATAYLLCRIADTIEDDPSLEHEWKTEFHQRFLAVIEGEEDAEAFAVALTPRLSDQVLPDERNLVRNTARVVRVLRGFSTGEQQAVTRCLVVMCSGMPKFQRNKSLMGLRDLEELGAYCCVVAGVVGELLAELFCMHCPDLLKHRRKLRRLAVSFGLGLQMTNILKDTWEDRRRGTCWLPQVLFRGRGSQLKRLEKFHSTDDFQAGLRSLIGVTHRHLRNALEFTCMIPMREAGIRRFCLWTLGLAIMTLKKLYRNPYFTSGDEVKVSRRTVKATILASNLNTASNRRLRWLFSWASRGLPISQAQTATVMCRAGRPHGVGVDRSLRSDLRSGGSAPDSRAVMAAAMRSPS